MLEIYRSLLKHHKILPLLVPIVVVHTVQKSDKNKTSANDNSAAEMIARIRQDAADGAGDVRTSEKLIEENKKLKERNQQLEAENKKWKELMFRGNYRNPSIYFSFLLLHVCMFHTRCFVFCL